MRLHTRSAHTQKRDGDRDRPIYTVDSRFNGLTKQFLLCLHQSIYLYVYSFHLSSLQEPFIYDIPQKSLAIRIPAGFSMKLRFSKNWGPVVH